MRLIALLIFTACSMSMWAQSDIVSALTRKQKAGEGTVVLHQDARLKALLQAERPVSASGTDERVAKIAGFRVQVYAGNNSRQARNEANQMSAKVREAFP